MTEDDVEEFENKVCPTCGSCSGMYTANSMNCLTEVLGMGLRGNGTIPAVYSERIKLAKHAGMQVMEMLQKEYPSERYHDRRSSHECTDCRHGTGMLLLTVCCICRQSLMKSDLISISAMANEVSAKTPNLCHLAPAGPTYMEDLNEAGGVYAVMNELSKIEPADIRICMTVTGKTVRRKYCKLR